MQSKILHKYYTFNIKMYYLQRLEILNIDIDNYSNYD